MKRITIALAAIFIPFLVVACTADQVAKFQRGATTAKSVVDNPIVQVGVSAVPGGSLADRLASIALGIVIAAAPLLIKGKSLGDKLTAAEGALVEVGSEIATFKDPTTPFTPTTTATLNKVGLAEVAAVPAVPTPNV